MKATDRYCRYPRLNESDHDMMIHKILRDSTKTALVVALVFASGCSSDRAARNVYEGIQSHNQSLKTPQEKASEPTPQSYQDYERERERLKSAPSAQ